MPEKKLKKNLKSIVDNMTLSKKDKQLTRQMEIRLLIPSSGW